MQYLTSEARPVPQETLQRPLIHSLHSPAKNYIISDPAAKIYLRSAHAAAADHSLVSRYDLAQVDIPARRNLQKF